MGDPFSDLPILEQSRRRLLIAGLSVAGLLAAWWLGSRSGPRAPGELDVARVFGPGEPVTAEVLNATPRRGLGRLATRHLRRAGVDVLYFGTADGVPGGLDTTEILVRRGEDSGAAVRLRRVVGAARIRLAPDTLLRVDLTILLGGTYRPPPSPRP